MQFDLIIVGGGLAGLSLAVALRAAPLSIAIVEERPAPVAPRAPDWDARVYAISPANQRFLDQMGVWQRLDHGRLAPVTTMEIFGDAGGRLEFSAYDSGVTELAWIVESSLLGAELWETAKRQGNVTLLCPVAPRALDIGSEEAQLTLADGRILHTALVVGADGAESWTRQAAGIVVRFTPYGEMGAVANFACELPHRDCALQWFRDDGVLAWLPMPGNRLSMVWSTPDAHAHELLSLTPRDLCERVAAAGNWRLGEFSLLTPPAAFPLRLMRAPRCVGPRLALIGDAAHTLHPLSGHGINLGLQDGRALAAVLGQRPVHVDCGDERLLRRYERSRREEVFVLQSVTHALQHLFRPRHVALSWLRNSGLNLTNALPVVRDALVRYALG